MTELPALQLDFAPGSMAGFIEAIGEQLMAGVRHIRLRPDNPLSREIAAFLHERAQGIGLRVEIVAATAEASSAPVPLTVLCETDPDRLSALLLDYLDAPAACLLAPMTAHHFQARPLFLISIPKSGTHLLYEFAQTLGFARAAACPMTPQPGVAYFIQGEHSHTRAKDFLGESPWHAPFANRHHPFLRAPALFIYRNPLDILVSEANWYHEDGLNVFAGYYSGLSFEQRLLKLVDDPWLLGSIRDRVGAFAAWLDMPNVIPIAFEEIVGAQGGGDAALQQRLVWSLQLKLHVPGLPAELAERVFNPNSPTFRGGQVHGYRRRLTPEARAAFEKLPQDFMALYGYDGPDTEAPVVVPRHASALRRRPVRVSQVDPGDSPVTLETNFLGHNLVQFRGRIFALHWTLGSVDLPSASAQQLARLTHGNDLNQLKAHLMLASRPAAA
jgi:hypothetical protein